MGSSRKLPIWLRWWGLGLGAVTLFWLPVEDTTTLALELIAAGWGIWLAGWAYQQIWLEARLPKQSWRHIAVGAIAGFMLFPVTLFLVLIKAGLHRHGFLDFSIYQLGELLIRMPLWIALGGLGGALKNHFFPAK